MPRPPTPPISQHFTAQLQVTEGQKVYVKGISQHFTAQLQVTEGQKVVEGCCTSSHPPSWSREEKRGGRSFHSGCVASCATTPVGENATPTMEGVRVTGWMATLQPPSPCMHNNPTPAHAGPGRPVTHLQSAQLSPLGVYCSSPAYS